MADWCKVQDIAEDLVEIVASIRRGDDGPYVGTEDAARKYFCKIADELDYVVKHVPRTPPRCPFTVEMAL